MRTLLIVVSVSAVATLLVIWLCLRGRKRLIPWIALVSVAGAAVAIGITNRVFPTTETPDSPRNENRELSKAEEYAEGQLTGGPERLSEYSASVQCKDGLSLVHPFVIKGVDLRKAVDACEVTRVATVADGTRNVVESYEIGAKLAVGKMPLDQLDLAMRDLLGKEIDRRLMVAFFEKHDLAPPLDSISTKVDWGEPAGATVRVVVAHRETTDHIPGVTRTEADGRAFKSTIDRIVRSRYEDTGFRNFKLRMNQILSQADVHKYFADGDVNRATLARFLRDYVSVEFEEPTIAKQARDVEQQQREHHSREELELRLLEGYFQKQGLVVPSEKVQIKTAWNPKELEIAVSAKDLDIKPFRHQIPNVPNPKSASVAEKKKLDQATEGIIRIFQLFAGEEMFAKKVGELVSAEDQKEFFDGGKVVTRARLVKYLRARAEQLGFGDILKTPSHEDHDEPVEAKHQ